jgi:hypothetical protein
MLGFSPFDGAASFLDAEIFRGWLERHSINPLFRKLHGIETDAAGLVALLLRRHVKPILLLDGIASALGVAGRVSLLGLLPRCVMERFTHYDPACRAGGGDERIAVW